MTTIRSLTPAQARALVASGHAVIVDVREPIELAICCVDGALSFPLQSFPRAVDGIPRDVTIICLCHHGVRSLHAARWLDANGFDVANLEGGIERWAIDLEPSMPRY